MIRKAKKIYIVLSVCMLVMGLLLMIFPNISVRILCCGMGILFLCIGIVKIVGYFSNDLYHLAFQFDLAFGLFTGILGLLLLFRPEPVIVFLPTVIGLFILADGVLRIQTAKDACLFGMSKWWTILVLGLVTVLFGLLLIVKPFESTLAMTILLGATLLVDAVQNLLVVWHTVKTDRSKYIDGKYVVIK